MRHCFRCAPNRWKQSFLPCCSVDLKTRHELVILRKKSCSSCAPLHFPTSFNLHLPFQHPTSRIFKETPLFPLSCTGFVLTTTVTEADRDCMYIVLWSDLMADVFALEKVLKHKGHPQNRKQQWLRLARIFRDQIDQTPSQRSID